MNQNFIITLDVPTANKLIAAGFSIVSKQGNTYTFMNQPPKNFDFDVVDKTKIYYTNMLCM